MKNTQKDQTEMDGKRRKRKIRDDSHNCLIYQAYQGDFYGGADQGRTGDLLTASQALSQLSYSPT